MLGKYKQVPTATSNRTDRPYPDTESQPQQDVPTPERLPERWRWLYVNPRGSYVLHLHMQQIMRELGTAEAALAQAREVLNTGIVNMSGEALVMLKRIASEELDKRMRAALATQPGKATGQDGQSEPKPNPK